MNTPSKWFHQIKKCDSLALFSTAYLCLIPNQNGASASKDNLSDLQGRVFLHIGLLQSMQSPIITAYTRIPKSGNVILQRAS